MREQLAVVQSGFANTVDWFTDVFPNRLDELSAQLRVEETEILSGIPPSLFGLIVPSKQDLLRSVIRRWFRRARSKVQQEKKRYLRLKDRSSESLIVEIRRFLEDYDFQLTTLTNDIQNVVDGLERSRCEGDHIQATAIAAVQDARSGLIKEFGVQAERIYQDVGRVIRLWHHSVQGCKDALLREAKPVGMDEKLRTVLR